MSYYGNADLASCPQHREVKLLANRFWVQWSNAGDRLAEAALADLPDPKRIEGLALKCDRLHQQFSDCRRGIDKCCPL